MQSLMIQSLVLGASAPQLFKLTPGMGFPAVLLVGLILWFGFLAVFGAFRK